MVELSNKVTKDEWVRFKVLHSRYLAKKKSKTRLAIVTFCLLAAIISGTVLFQRVEDQLINVVASFPFPIRVRRGIAMDILLDRFLLTGLFFLFFLNELFQRYKYLFPWYVGKQVTDWEEEFFESHVCLTEDAIWSYSIDMDVRVKWDQLKEVFQSEEVITLFARDGQRIVISKGSLTERRLKLVEERLSRCFKGEIIEL